MPGSGWSIRCGWCVTVGSEERVRDQLQPLFGSSLRNELGKRPFVDLAQPRARRSDGQYPERAAAARQPVRRRDRRRADQADRSADRIAARQRAQPDGDGAAAGSRDDPGAGAKGGARSSAPPRRRRPRRSMPRRSTRTRLSTISIARCSPIGRPSSRRARARGETSIVLSPQNSYLREFMGQR